MHTHKFFNYNNNYFHNSNKQFFPTHVWHIQSAEVDISLEHELEVRRWERERNLQADEPAEEAADEPHEDKVLHHEHDVP